MRESAPGAGRDTFIYDPGQGNTIPRKALLEAPLVGYYENLGFDANFLTWASEGRIQAGSIRWSGCAPYEHPEPCPPELVAGYDPVFDAVSDGWITAVHSGSALIALVCGNFTLGGAPGPVPTITGFKYEDVNANGQRDPEDKGLPGWEMKLIYDGKEVARTTTDANGHYSFALDANVLPVGEGTYQVEEVQQPGWYASHTPASVFVKLGVGGEEFAGNDFGNYRLATISGHKFDDSNVNGQRDLGENGLKEWTMLLSNGEQRSTDGEGAYSFSVRPGTYTLGELMQAGWRQTDPGGEGTRTYTVTSGQEVGEADFGNVCLGGVEVKPVDDSTGEPLSGLDVRIEEMSVPGILKNEPGLPRSTTETPTFGELLPGTYRVVTFLPEGVFTADTSLTIVEGRFAVVKEVTVGECHATELPVHLFTRSSYGKVTGGVKIGLPSGYATSGFVFMYQPAEDLHGSLQYNDHFTGLNLHTSTVQGLWIEGNVATVWGLVPVEGTPQRFVLRLTDAGEPGTEDRYELMVLPGYDAGQNETLMGGNVQLHT